MVIVVVYAHVMCRWFERVSGEDSGRSDSGRPILRGWTYPSPEQELQFATPDQQAQSVFWDLSSSAAHHLRVPGKQYLIEAAMSLLACALCDCRVTGHGLGNLYTY